MRGTFAIILSLGVVGCAEHGATPAAPLVDDPDPGHCTQLALDGAAGSSMELGPWTLGATTVCLHLDASRNRFAHFMASTTSEDGAASSFTLALTDASGATVVDGWDVTVGQTAPATFANVELPIDGGTVRDLVLHVGAHDGVQATTPVSVALFERLD